MNKFFYTLLLIIIPLISFNQNYYIPYNLLKCYEDGTRDFSGKPGKNYFQNESSYFIKANFNPIKGILKGSEQVTYYNNSSDTLYQTVIRLYHNIFKKGNIRSEAISEEYINGGVKINSLIIENIQYINNSKVFIRNKGANMIFNLPDDLLPGDSIKLLISWTTKIPATHLHRFGNYGSSDWFIAYWYPQVAVYDDIDGWDLVNYTGTTEFYNDFSNFNVEITVPKNHMVWATGNWLNPGKILNNEILERYKYALEADNQVNIITSADWEHRGVFNKSNALKYRFIAEDVTDFAFAVSDDFLWDSRK